MELSESFQRWMSTPLPEDRTGMALIRQKKLLAEMLSMSSDDADARSEDLDKQINLPWTVGED